MVQKQNCRLYYGYLICALLIPMVRAEDSHCTIGSAQRLNDASDWILFLDLMGDLLTEAIKMVDNSMANQRREDVGTKPKECVRIANVGKKPKDCAEVYRGQDKKNSGVYKIWPRSKVLSGPIDVYCDMEDDGGGWTVFQRRGDFGSPADLFYQNWTSYKLGFGDLTKDFWLGNNNLFALTSQKVYILKITLEDFEGDTKYATYDDFSVAEEPYALNVQGYNGTAGDSFSKHHSKKRFSTYDRDNDGITSGNCAERWKGGWWYSHCFDSNLNGIYGRGSQDATVSGVTWRSFRGLNYSLKNTVMKIRPKTFGQEQ